MKETINQLQEDFLDDEFWVLTFGGAFQRANVYLPWVNESERTELRRKLKWIIKALVSRQYYEDVSHDEHMVTLKELSYGTKHLDNILQNGRLNFGVTQKLFNLYLKYLWRR